MVIDAIISTIDELTDLRGGYPFRGSIEESAAGESLKVVIDVGTAPAARMRGAFIVVTVPDQSPAMIRVPLLETDGRKNMPRSIAQGFGDFLLSAFPELPRAQTGPQRRNIFGGIGTWTSLFFATGRSHQA